MITEHPLETGSVCVPLAALAREDGITDDLSQDPHILGASRTERVPGLCTLVAQLWAETIG